MIIIIVIAIIIIAIIIIFIGNSNSYTCKQMSLILAHIAQVGDSSYLSSLFSTLVEIHRFNQSIITHDDIEAYSKASLSTTSIIMSILNELLLPENVFVVSSHQSQSSLHSSIKANKLSLNERNALHIFHIQDCLGTSSLNC